MGADAPSSAGQLQGVPVPRKTPPKPFGPFCGFVLTVFAERPGVLFTRCATGVEGAARKALWAKCKPGAAESGTRSPFLGPRADTAQKGPHLIVTHGQSSCYIFMFASNSYQAPPYVNDQFHFFVFILFFFKYCFEAELSISPHRKVIIIWKLHLLKCSTYILTPFQKPWGPQGALSYINTLWNSLPLRPRFFIFKHSNRKNVMILISADMAAWLYLHWFFSYHRHRHPHSQNIFLELPLCLFLVY